MNAPVLKAFVLCEYLTDNPENPERKDLQGAGLAVIRCGDKLPMKFSFWAFVQLSDPKSTAAVRLAIMRADSGRRYYFRPVTIRYRHPLRATVLCIRVHDCVFPERGVYFLELWYDETWLVDQRLEVI